ncbi:MAG: metal-dependent hydrolase [Marinosulfonomonas sp.]|nr:MAG: metal-dependent hydrolase [Marinosulfonomonas sp.]
MMRLSLLGTGTPRPSIERQCTANLVQIGDVNIMVDAGRGAVAQLVNLGHDPVDIDYIFITHHHFDHIGNLGDLIMAAWNNGRDRPVHIFGPDGTADIIDHLFAIYRRDIEFRLLEERVLGSPIPDIRDLLQVTHIVAGDGYQGDGWSVVAGQVEHGHGLGLSHEEWPCFGYRIMAGDKVLTISGDTIDCDGVRALAAGADLLLQCCYLAEAEIDGREKRLLSDVVLASAKQASRIARAAGVGKMVLTHLAPKSDAMLQAALEEACDGFTGEVVLGADLMVIDV